MASRKLAANEPVVRLERSEGTIVRASRTFVGVGNGVLISVGSQKAESVSTDGLMAAPGKAVVYDEAGAK